MKKNFLIFILFFTLSHQKAQASFLDELYNFFLGPKKETQPKNTTTSNRTNFVSPTAGEKLLNYFTDIPQTPPVKPNVTNTLPRNPVDDFNQNTDAKKAIQKFLGVKEDGIIGKQTSDAIKEFQSANKLDPTGKIDEKTLEKLDEEMDNSERNDPKIDLGGSGKGDSLGQMRGTNFCTTKNGGRDRDGVISCGVYTGDCRNLGKKPNPETVAACETCTNCQYIKGSCGTPLYFYKGSTSNAQTEANKEIRAVALTQSKLKEVFGSSSQSAYCSKSINVCYGSPDNCKQFPVRDTGHARADTIDMTGAVFNDLDISDDINPVNMNKLFVYRIEQQPKNNTQVAEVK